jgi:hypothetical protein
MDIDTSPKAVEKLASQCQSAERVLAALDEFPSGQGVLKDAAATLRALAAERDAGLIRERDANASAMLHKARAEAAEAEVARLQGALPRAWVAGRDAAAHTYWHGSWYRNPDSLAAMKQITPPADLIAALSPPPVDDRIGAGADSKGGEE